VDGRFVVEFYKLEVVMARTVSSPDISLDGLRETMKNFRVFWLRFELCTSVIQV
jgi:hypothetical protein